MILLIDNYDSFSYNLVQFFGTVEPDIKVVRNDNFYMDGDTVKKRTNHSGGTLGGMSDGSPILIRASFKPTPSIFQAQDTVTWAHEEIVMEIKGRHDPIIGPRAVVVVESMCAITVLDLLMQNATAKLDNLKRIYRS